MRVGLLWLSHDANMRACTHTASRHRNEHHHYVLQQSTEITSRSGVRESQPFLFCTSMTNDLWHGRKCCGYSSTPSFLSSICPLSTLAYQWRRFASAACTRCCRAFRSVSLLHRHHRCRFCTGPSRTGGPTERSRRHTLSLLQQALLVCRH